MTGNTATSAAAAGGAIYAQDATLGFAGPATLHTNVSEGIGGAIAADGASVTFSDAASIHGNSAADAATGGGAVHLTDSDLTIGGAATLDGNTATAGAGGALYARDSTVTSRAPRRSSATRPHSPAAPWTSAGDVDFADAAAITGNTAGEDGGAIAIAGGAVTFAGAAGLDGNSAGGDGGAVIVGAGGRMAFDAGASFTGNAATGSGGAVALMAADAALRITGAATLGGNQAGVSGGAIYSQGGVVSLDAIGGDITFEGNTAGGEPNAMFFADAGDPLALELNADADHAIFFHDPIESTAAAGNFVAVTKTGDGRVVFDGASLVDAITSVTAGTFELAPGASYGRSDTGATSFTVNDGATLETTGIAGPCAPARSLSTMARPSRWRTRPCRSNRPDRLRNGGGARVGGGGA